MKPKLLKHKADILTFLHSCLEREDWHGVSDAANDIREIEAKIEQEDEIYRLKMYITERAGAVDMEAIYYSQKDLITDVRIHGLNPHQVRLLMDFYVKNTGKNPEDLGK